VTRDGVCACVAVGRKFEVLRRVYNPALYVGVHIAAGAAGVAAAGVAVVLKGLSNGVKFGTLKEQEPLGLGGWVVSDDHTSVEWFRRANEPQKQIGEPYLLSVDIYDIINAIVEWLVRTGASTSTLMVDTW
jgi:hypothetical protein